MQIGSFNTNSKRQFNAESFPFRNCHQNLDWSLSHLNQVWTWPHSTLVSSKDHSHFLSLEDVGSHERLIPGWSTLFPQHVCTYWYISISELWTFVTLKMGPLQLTPMKQRESWHSSAVNITLPDDYEISTAKVYVTWRAWGYYASPKSIIMAPKPKRQHVSDSLNQNDKAIEMHWLHLFQQRKETYCQN